MEIAGSIIHRGSKSSPIRFTRAICGDLGQAERREWWIANGRGAYAGGTIAGSLTRRYHGLLIAPVATPLGRRLIVAKADATVIVGARSWPLFTNRWKSGDITPAGHVRIGYFHGDNGRGCGASHQTGWTGLVANLIAQRAAEQSMEGDYRARTKQDEPGAVLSRPFPG